MHAFPPRLSFSQGFAEDCTFTVFKRWPSGREALSFQLGVR